jgi:sarcosine oxidase subunit alpha
MHVLRAEKGYPIIGQDTDGTITPQDPRHELGRCRRRSPDFVGKRSFTRSENLNPVAQQFVGLLPTDADTVLPEGAQIIEFIDGGELPPPPGADARPRHIELPQRRNWDARSRSPSSRAGHARIGETLHVPVDGALVPVEVTGSVLVDPEGARRDG